MDINPSELPEKGYVLLDELKHDELVPFIRTYMKKRTGYAIFYFAFNVIALACVVFFFAKGYHQDTFDFGDRFTQISYGLAIAFALVPLHEYIHVLAYRSQGAKNTSYDVNLKKFYFMALSDKFVSNKKEFEIVALAPFVVITSILIILLFVVKSTWILTVLGVLFAHSSMCSGDFGLLSFFEFHKEKEVVTYDDVENKISYFYGRPASKA